jgi:general secretion pathway protein H
MRVRSKVLPAASGEWLVGPRREYRRQRLCSAADRTSYECGFTLLELAVVIFIMGLMLLIALPYFGGLKGEQLRSAARRMAGRATYLFEEASARKLVIRLVFDLNDNSYHVFVLDPYAAQPLFTPDHAPGGAPVFLPPNIAIRDVTVEGIGTCRRGLIACQFYPEGYVDATLIHLVDSSGDVLTLGITPFTGQVLIANGDLTAQQLFTQ